ncbi:putative superfamily III holin-X [Jatrophihabitans sp. GAS493]|uniref:phage holin family protein n=1 Tax=Jatrophihabitans sp. GAS493 TaxID=1907575 RepID=UPI000BB8E8C5|nr:phage holin family protein [Jatrophihabitans sp. GAS493]SOD74928.1 putative superfamily III holin-X [Jatrophihabitans sp. GAS493]
MTTQFPASSDQTNASTGELVSRITEQMTTLVRDEFKLAQLEMNSKAKRVGLGTGLFGGAGVVAWFGLGALVAAAILGLSNAVSPWLAAVIVGAVLLVVAGLLALSGKREIAQATPPLPEQAISGVETDVAIVKEAVHR